MDEKLDSEEIFKLILQIMDRLDDIEEKINTILSNDDPYNLNDYFKAKNTMPDGYTLVDTSGESDTSRTFGVIIDG